MKITHFLIPGNPAVSDLYTQWVEEIKELDNSINIFYSHSHTLFNKNLNFEKYYQAMFLHYENIFLKLSSTQPINILSHSVGGYFALKLLEKYPEKIQRVILIYPYIGHSTIKQLRFVNVLYIIDRFFPLTEILVWSKKILQKYKKDLSFLTKKEFSTYLRFGLKQCTYFNVHSSNALNISMHRNKIHFIYNNNDKWCPESTLELLKPISNFKLVDLPHDFILKKDTREKMTREIMNDL